MGCFQLAFLTLPGITKSDRNAASLSTQRRKVHWLYQGMLLVSDEAVSAKLSRRRETRYSLYPIRFCEQDSLMVRTVQLESNSNHDCSRQIPHSNKGQTGPALSFLSLVQHPARPNRES